MPKKFPGKREVGGGGHEQRGKGGAEGDGGGTWTPMRTRNMDNRRPVVRPVPSTSTPRRRIDPLPLESQSAPSTSDAQQEGSPEMDPIARAMYRNRVAEEWANTITQLVEMTQATLQKNLEAVRGIVGEKLGDKQIGGRTEGRKAEGMGSRVGEDDDATPNPAQNTRTDQPTYSGTRTNACTDTPTERVEDVRCTPQASGVDSAPSVLPSWENSTPLSEPQHDAIPGYRLYTLPEGTTEIYLLANSAPPALSNPDNSVPQVHPTTSSISQSDLGTPDSPHVMTMVTDAVPRYSSIGDQSQQTHSSNRKHELPVVGEVPTFNGDPPGASGAMAAGLFLRRIEMETKGARWNDALRIILTRKQLRGTARETWMALTTEMENWEEFKRSFKEIFQIPRVVNDTYLNTYTPQRKPRELLTGYVRRVHSYLDNFHPDGNMNEGDKLAHLKHILLQTLPRPMCGVLYTAETLKEVMEGIEIATYTNDWLRLSPAEIAHEELPGRKTTVGATGAATASAIAAGTSHGREREDRRPQKTPFSSKTSRGARGRGKPNKGGYSGPVGQARPSPGRRNRNQNGCWNCGSDHPRRECSNAVACFKCQRRGHVARDCWKKTQENGNLAAGTPVGGPSYPPYYLYSSPVAAPSTPFPMFTYLPSTSTSASQLGSMWGTQQGSTPSPGGLSTCRRGRRP